MKAMIFAAGLGTRLRPLTNTRPKALVEVSGMPLLEIAIRRLMYFGCKKIIVNIHHFGEQVLQFLESKQNFGIEIVISDERDLLLDTGGGLKKAAGYLREAPFIIHNVDILTNLDLSAFYQAHLQSGAIATLAVRKRESSRYLLFDQKNSLCGWRNTRTGEIRLCRHNTPWSDFAFSGIHVLSPEIFDHLPDKAVFSIIDVYLELGRKREIKAFPHDEDIWLDVGKPASLEQAQEVLSKLRMK